MRCVRAGIEHGDPDARAVKLVGRSGGRDLGADALGACRRRDMTERHHVGIGGDGLNVVARAQVIDRVGRQIDRRDVELVEMLSKAHAVPIEQIQELRGRRTLETDERSDPPGPTGLRESLEKSWGDLLQAPRRRRGSARRERARRGSARVQDGGGRPGQGVQENGERRRYPRHDAPRTCHPRSHVVLSSTASNVAAVGRAVSTETIPLSRAPSSLHAPGLCELPANRSDSRKRRLR